MESERIVRKIPPTPKAHHSNSPSIQTRRVAAYTRVSTDEAHQLLSNEAQMDYYKQYIATHANWEFCGLYVDQGITGTSTKKRDSFNQMIKDALEGKIDLIITKSISRFARNTVDISSIAQTKNQNFNH